MISFLKSGAKVILFFDMCKFFTKKMQKKCVFLTKRTKFLKIAQF